MLVYLALIDEAEDKLAFEELYHKLKPLMFYIANKILNNPMDAEDTVHEACIALAENFSKIPKNNAHKSRAYFVTVVERKAIDLYRRKQAHPSISFDEELSDAVFPAPGEGPAAAAMSRIPVKYRELLYLKHICGFKSKEIGKLMGMSDTMVRRSLSDARAALRVELEKEGIEV